MKPLSGLAQAGTSSIVSALSDRPTNEIAIQSTAGAATELKKQHCRPAGLAGGPTVLQRAEEVVEPDAITRISSGLIAPRAYALA